MERKLKKGNNSIINSGDYYIIDGIKYLNSNTNLFFNYTTNSYDNINNYILGTLVYGIVKISADNKITKGYFIDDKFTNITLILANKTRIQGLNYNLVKGLYLYRESLSDGYFYYYKILKSINFSSKKEVLREEKNKLPYNLSGEYKKEFENNYKITEKSKISKTASNINTMIEGLSFGLEFETVTGFIPPRLTGKVGLAPLRDGSIRGLEYVTIPLEGAQGVQSLIDITKLLKERTEFDNSCALHLHLGNIPRTKSFILAFYLFTLGIQDDIFSLFPITKLFNWGLKNKNYCKPYDKYDIILQLDKKINKININKNFNILLANLAMSTELDNFDLKDIKNHPSDPSGLHKWQVRTRYYWMNMVPIIFGNKQTLEFRIHTPTFKTEKVLFYLLICSAMVNFVKKNQTSILNNFYMFKKIKIYDIIKKTFGIYDNNLFGKLLDYIAERKRESRFQNAKGEINGREQDIFISKINDIYINSKEIGEYHIHESTHTINIKKKQRLKPVSIKSFPRRNKGTSSLDELDDILKTPFNTIGFYNYSTTDTIKINTDINKEEIISQLKEIKGTKHALFNSLPITPKDYDEKI